MRQRWVVAGIGCVAALALVACAHPAGTDGNMSDEWAMPTEPKLPAPTAGTCFTTESTNAFRLDPADLTTIPCTVDHAVEVAHVGQVSGAGASGSSAPAPDEAAGKAAYADCATRVREFLGDEWQAARLHMAVRFPSERQWAAGARFYHCDLVEIDNEEGKLVSRTNTLRDGLRGAKPAALACVNDVGKDSNSVDGINFVACATKHTAEFAGVYTVSPARAYPPADELRRLVSTGCGALAEKYLSLDSADIPDALGWFSLGTNQEDWAQGNQSVRCYVGVFDRDQPIRAGATIRNLGSKPIPR